MKALYPIKSKIKHFKIVGYDTETYSNKNLFLLSGIFDEKYIFYTNKRDTIKALNVYKKGYIIATTNLQFDFTVTYLTEKEFFDYNIIMRQGTFISCNKRGQKFIDTMNYSKASVKNLGNMLGISKLIAPSCLGKIPKNSNEWKYLKVYNSKDCLISKKFIEYSQKSLNILGAELKSTIASSAMNLYQRKYLKFPIHHERKNQNKFIFKSYYGGRVECINRGSIKAYLKKHKKKHLYFYDFNSLYPAVMMNEYPLPESCIQLKNFKSIEHYINKYHGVTKCRIQTPEYMKYPILPYRSDEGKLIFPLGEFTGVWNNKELKIALENGYKILRVYKSIYYKRTFYPFREYVTDLYNKRLYYQKKNNNIMAYFTKILLNSLYGKTGTRRIDKTIFFDINKTKKRSFEILEQNVGYIIEERECKGAYVFPIFASLTTAYARIKLWYAINENNALYYDTDSLITINILKDSKKLGELKLEKIITKGVLVRPKMYMINEEVKLKGIRFQDNKVKIFNDILSGKAIKQRKFLKIKESIKRKMGMNEIIEFLKFAHLEDDKRYWKSSFNKYKTQESFPIIV